MTKLVLKNGVDRNGHRAPRFVRASPTVEAVPVTLKPKRVGAKSLVPDRKTAPTPTYGDYHAPTNAAERSFERGVTDDLTYIDGGGAILHIEDRASGLSSDSFIDTSSDEAIRADTWAVVNRLMDRVARANARAGAKAERPGP